MGVTKANWLFTSTIACGYAEKKQIESGTRFFFFFFFLKKKNTHTHTHGFICRLKKINRKLRITSFKFLNANIVAQNNNKRIR
jgi:hypothetical protein